MKTDIFIEFLKQDLKQKYFGSLLGSFWSFFNPIATFIVIWIVMEYGFHRKNIEGVPYIVWFGAGMIPWMYFAEALINTTYSIKQKSYLIKKTTINAIFLPLIKAINSFLIYIILFLVFILIVSIYNIKINCLIIMSFILYWCYLFLLVFFTGLFFSSIIVFLSDIGEMVNLLIRFGFWLTPIFWNINKIPKKYHFLFEINPIYYVIKGIRDTVILHKFFWNKIETLYFLIFLFILGFISVKIFHKLKIHFGDVI